MGQCVVTSSPHREDELDAGPMPHRFSVEPVFHPSSFAPGSVALEKKLSQ